MRVRPLAAIGALLLTLAPAQAQSLRFSGFGDTVFGKVGGGMANPAAAERFERFGADADPVNTTRGFGITGTDFVVIADLNENVTFLGEVNLQAGRGRSNDISLDVERLFVNYQFDPRFNVQAGLMFTPIGYNNRFLYARAWLMNSIQVPDFFEEELNLFPTHSVGVAFHGEFELGSNHRLAYILSAANGRATAPDQAIYARDNQDNKEVTGLVEWLIPGYKDSRVGVSGWFGNVDSVSVDALGDIVDAQSADPLALAERGLDVYLVVNHRRFSVNAEYVRSTQRSRGGTATAADVTSGGLVEVSAHMADGRVHPYVRFDGTSLPENGGRYAGVREVEGGYTRVYVPEFKAVMSGVAYDLNQNVRAKGEYLRHLGGPRARHNLTFQLAFGF